MPREWTEPVVSTGKPDPQRWYAMQVRQVDRNRDPKGVQLELDFLDYDQLGRVHRQVLPLPVQPEGLSGRFFQACGMNVQVGQSIAPRKALGAHLSVRFMCGPREEWLIAGFKSKEMNNESDAESTSV